MDIVIDATKLHPSTRLSLTALEWLEDRITPANILEIGCGNGILSLACTQLWPASILACDISENAVADARANALEYAPDADITILRSDGMKHPDIKAHGPYQLIIANLIPQWQVQMAASISEQLDAGGAILLSGILLWQEQGLKEAFVSLNINIIQRFDENEWCCLILRR
jgi:ribosomal protein L11 methyltransferase